MARPAPPALAFQDDAALLTPGPVRDRLLANMRRQGAKNVRLNAIYGRVKAEGYGAYDDAVNAIRHAGLSPQMTIMGTPAYSPQWDQTLSAAHQDPRVWQQFAGEVAQHFKGRVKRYSVGNEPNIDAFQAGAGNNARQAGRQYRNVYRSGYAGIKHADPGAQVLLGEVTSAPNAREFLAGVMGGKPLKTAGFAYHPYDQPGKPTSTWDIDTLNDLQATLGRYKRQGRLQTAQGQAAPLYLTEFGVQQGAGTKAQRLRMLSRAYTKAAQAGAREFLQYQAVPTVRPTVTTPGQTSADAYGNAFTGPGHTGQAPGWVWDTSIGDMAGNLPVINRGLRPVARTARARAARKKR